MSSIKHFFILAIVLLEWATLSANAPFSHGRLQVSASNRFLQYSDGTPFLYMGDTAWELFHRLTFQEACRYLRDRAAKNFNVIQAVVITELDTVGRPAACGYPSLIDMDINKPNPGYFAHIDSVISYAASLGLYMAVLPIWGDKVDKQWGIGPKLLNVARARRYGHFLGKRWRSHPNIIWIIGGDRSGGGSNKAVWNALAEAIKENDHNHLMTFHPQGEHSSSMWFHDESWLDFNMFQSGHCQSSYDIYRRLLFNDLSLSPRKPVMDGEPRYEDIPVCFKGGKRFSAIDIRRALYQSVLSGACGFTYGNNNVWQMYAPGRKPECSATTYWYNALSMEGACQLKYFIELWHRYKIYQGIKLDKIVRPFDGYCDDEAVACKTKKALLCYFPGGMEWEIDIPDSMRTPLSATWINPRTGASVICASPSSRHWRVSLPMQNVDWLLIITASNETDKI